MGEVVRVLSVYFCLIPEYHLLSLSPPPPLQQVCLFYTLPIYLPVGLQWLGSSLLHFRMPGISEKFPPHGSVENKEHVGDGYAVPNRTALQGGCFIAYIIYMVIRVLGRIC